MAQMLETTVSVEEETTPKATVLDRPLLGALSFNWEIAFYVALIVLSFLMRYWDLGTRAQHHDESLHALYSYNLFAGKGYQHDPMMHGPFLFESTALGYFLFGVSDYTSRITPALFGVILVILPYFLRRQLGRTGAMLAAIMLSFSPSILYYGRFIRHDIYVAVWSLLMVIAFWRYMEERKNFYLYLAAASISLSFATKEDTFITMAIFGLFLTLMNVRKLGLLFQRRVNLKDWPPSLVLALFTGTMILPQFGALVTLVQERMKLNLEGVTSLGGIVVTNESLAGGAVVVALLAISAALGYRFFGRIWLTAAALFYVPFTLLYTTFFTNMPGFGTGIWNSLGYWLVQHGVKRGDQPQYYYLILLAVYEFLPVALALIATGYYLVTLLRSRSGGSEGRKAFAGLGEALSRHAFTLFLIYWSFASLIGYSIAGEKMPWLLVPIALPIALLAAKFLGDMADRVDWRSLLSRNVLYLAILIPSIVGGLLAIFRVSGPVNQAASIGPNAQGVGLFIILVLCAGLAVQAGYKLGMKRSLQVLASVALGALFLLTVRAGVVVSFYNGDIPVEMLVYTQTSPEIPQIKAEIDRIALRSGQGKDLKITVDATNGFSWPWAWYLREYKNVDHPVLSNISGPPLGSVLLLHDNNSERGKPFLTKYSQPQKYHHRWWFPEDYRGMTFDAFMRDIFNWSNWNRWWKYFLYRDVTKQLGSENGQFYVQKDLVGTTVSRQSAPEPPSEYTQRFLSIKSVVTFGGKGSAPGQLNEPKAVAVDEQGNVFVMDSMNRRIQKYDPNGRLLAQVGREGSGNGEFMPNTGGAWGIAVDASGFVYVADTWNHRIQKFDSELKFVAKWGENADTKGAAQGNGGKFYGPRGIAVDAEGNVFVTDTGNHRVQKFSPDGEFLGAFGGVGSREGQLLEPVGIGADQEGNIFVADTWNRRIQMFDKNLKFAGQIPVASGWESTGIINKPHLAVEPSGNIVVTDPENHRLLRFSPGGTLLGVINRYGTDSSSFVLPVGVAADSSGNIYVAESGNGRVQKFEALK